MIYVGVVILPYSVLILLSPTPGPLAYIAASPFASECRRGRGRLACRTGSAE